MATIKIFNHPVIQHKISHLRIFNTPTAKFRELIDQITMLMCYEAFSDLPVKDLEVITPIAKTTGKTLEEYNIAIVPVLRAGLGMVNGITNIIPGVAVGHIGLYRDEETLEPHEYYCKLPKNIDSRQVIVLDPMLATGGSAVEAINFIKQRGGKKIKFMCIIASPQGIEALKNAHPDVDIYCAQLDECLNENGYIVPGLGDAGDRLFGTL